MPAPFSRLLPRPASVVAMIHTGPTPGAPGGTDRPVRQLDCAVERAVAEARLYAELGVDGLLIENRHDVPCIPERDHGPEVAAFMTRVAMQVKKAVRPLPVGVEVLTGADRTALAVVLAAGCDFVRSRAWEGGPARAGAALRYRRAIGAGQVPVWATLHTSDSRPLADAAHDAELQRADALVLQGHRDGEAPDPIEVEEARAATALPLIIGSGIDAELLPDYARIADAFIVGSAFKERGNWRAPICERRVRALVGAVEYARGRENVTERR